MNGKNVKICRLCKWEGDFQAPLFSPFSAENRILEKIEKCINIKISENDNRPKSICFGCVFKLESFAKFKAEATRLDGEDGGAAPRIKKEPSSAGSSKSSVRWNLRDYEEQEWSTFADDRSDQRSRYENLLNILTEESDDDDEDVFRKPKMPKRPRASIWKKENGSQRAPAEKPKQKSIGVYDWHDESETNHHDVYDLTPRVEVISKLHAK